MKTVSYALAIGSLMYAIVYMRPDIAHIVGVVNNFLANPKNKALGSNKMDHEVSQRGQQRPICAMVQNPMSLCAIVMLIRSETLI